MVAFREDRSSVQSNEESDTPTRYIVIERVPLIYLQLVLDFTKKSKALHGQSDESFVPSKILSLVEVRVHLHQFRIKYTAKSKAGEAFTCLINKLSFFSPA